MIFFANSPELNYNNLVNQENIIWLISSLRNGSKEFLREKIREKGLENLNTSHSALLSILYHSGGKLPMQDVVKGLKRNKSTITEMVKSAEKAGFVRKTISSDDKRAVIIELTEKASAIEKEFEGISTELIEKAFSGFNDMEKIAILSLLDKMNSNFNK